MTVALSVPLRPLACAAAVALAAWLPARRASAELRLPQLFSDHAVLQRDRPLHVWGWSSPGAAISVALAGRDAKATADRLGRWDAWFDPMKAGGPYVLSVSGDGGTQSVGDIMLGDVWLASGQSNMEMPLRGFPPTAYVRNAAAEIAAATDPGVRLLHMRHRSSEYPVRDIEDDWTLCTPQTAADFSAIGYFFAREIAAREHVTVGVIDSTWGGTPASSWVSMARLGSDANLLPAFAARAHLEADEADTPAILAAEQREDAAARARGLPAPSHDWRPPEESWRPAGLYNGMIAPLTGYTLKGVIWYQGETNSKPDRAPYYADLFKALISDWRTDFGQGRLPFIYAQIASFHSPKEDWGEVRNAQRLALDLRDTAMAVTTDVGDTHNVHPADKQTVAARLALAARAVAYGEPVAYASPLFRQVTGTPGGLRVWFDNADGLTTRGAPVTGFEIAGRDGAYVPAAAVIDHDTVVVSGPVVDPAYVRFNWANVAGGELYNRQGLPASTFAAELPTP